MLAGLFKNSACCLTGLGGCTGGAGLVPQSTQTNDVAVAGQPISYTITTTCNGECPPLNVRVTNSLPAGFLFLGATNEQSSWTYDPAGQQVIFRIGQMSRGESVDLAVTVAPMDVGMFTNLAVGRMSSTSTQETVWLLAPAMLTTVVAPSEDVAGRLKLRPSGSGGMELNLTGQPGFVYGVQTSVDLLNWSPVTNVFGPTWTQDILPWQITNASRRFFRAWCPP